MIRGSVMILLMMTVPAVAQVSPRSEPPKYVRFEFDGNPEQMLAEFLKTKAGQNIFQDLLQGKLKSLLDTPPGNIKELLERDRVGDPFLREMIDQFLKNNPELPQGDGGQFGEALKKFGESLQGNPELADAILKGLEQKLGPDVLKNLPDMIPPDAKGEMPDTPLPKLQDLIEKDASLEDQFGEWMADWLKDDNFREEVAEFLKETPELQDAVSDFVQSLQGEGMDASWLSNISKPGGNGFDLKPPMTPKMPFDVGSLPKLPTLKMPSLPRVNIPLPKLRNMSLPRLPGLGGMGSISGPPSVGLGGGGEWLYIAFAILGVGLAWWFLRNLRWTPSSERERISAFLAALPASITTRAELRRAFDGLALAQLGDKALPWNHRRVARQLGGDAAFAKAAQSFAFLYETARYTPGDDRLSDAEQVAVRQSLDILSQGTA